MTPRDPIPWHRAARTRRGRVGELRAARDALRAVTGFTIAVLVNGLLAILLICLAQAVGWWEVVETSAMEPAVAGLNALAGSGSRRRRRTRARLTDGARSGILLEAMASAEPRSR